MPNPQSPDKAIAALSGADFFKEFNTDEKIIEIIRTGSVLGRAPIVSMPHWGGIIPDSRLRALVARVNRLRRGRLTRPLGAIASPTRRGEVVSAQDVRSRPHEYAVVWRTDAGPTSSGRLELGNDDLVLHGSSEPEGLRILFDELSSVEIGRGATERINGDKSLVLERHSCERVLVAALGGVGLLGELTDLIARLRAEHAARACVAVVLPIRRGSAEAARRLVEEGPPFDVGLRFRATPRLRQRARGRVLLRRRQRRGGGRCPLAESTSAERRGALARDSRRPAAAGRRAIRLDADKLTRRPSSIDGWPSKPETDPEAPARLTRRLAQPHHPDRPFVIDDRQVVEPVLGHQGHRRLDRRGG